MQTLTAQQQQAQLQQQLEVLANSPFGDSPLFRSAVSVSKMLIMHFYKFDSPKITDFYKIISKANILYHVGLQSSVYEDLC